MHYSIQMHEGPSLHCTAVRHTKVHCATLQRDESAPRCCYCAVPHDISEARRYILAGRALQVHHHLVRKEVSK